MTMMVQVANSRCDVHNSRVNDTIIYHLSSVIKRPTHTSTTPALDTNKITVSSM